MRLGMQRLQMMLFGIGLGLLASLLVGNAVCIVLLAVGCLFAALWMSC